MRPQVLTWLAENVSAPRLRHILGVEQMCMALARHYQIDHTKAGRAGLMHDLAKSFPPTRLLQMAKENGIEVDLFCQAHPQLLHADVSATIARNDFEIEDEEILAAISNHTLGRPYMSPFCCVVYVADDDEPSRGETKDLVAMRKVSRENLCKSVYQTSDYSLRYLLDSRRPIHPRTILTRNWARQEAKHFQESLPEREAKKA